MARIKASMAVRILFFCILVASASTFLLIQLCKNQFLEYEKDKAWLFVNSLAISYERDSATSDSIFLKRARYILDNNSEVVFAAVVGITNKSKPLPLKSHILIDNPQEFVDPLNPESVIQIGDLSFFNVVAPINFTELPNSVENQYIQVIFSMSGFDEKVFSFTRKASLILFFVIVLFWVSCYVFLSKKIFTPLKRIVFSLQNLNENQNFSEKGSNAPVDIDELYELVQSLCAKVQQAESDREEYKNKLHAVSKSSRDGIVIVDEKGKIVFWNRAAENIFNVTEEESLGEDINRYFKGKVFSCTFSRRHWALFNGTTFETTGLTKRGDHSPIKFFASETWIKNKWHGVAVVRDISLQKRDDYEHEGFQLAMNQLAAMLMITNTQGDIQYVNKAFEQFMGYTGKEVIGKSIDFLEKRTLEGGLDNEFSKIFSKGKTWEGTLKSSKKNGGYFYENLVITPVINSKGSLIKYVLLMKDVTHALKEQKIENKKERVTALEAVVAGMSHDINNSLSSINGYCRMLLDNLGENSKELEMLERIFDSVTRAANNVKRVMLFNASGETVLEVSNLSKIVQEEIDNLKKEYVEEIDINFNVKTDGIVLAETDQIKNVIIDLCDNAVYAIRAKGYGTLEVRLDQVALETSSEVTPNLKPGMYAKLSFHDTGSGIAEINLDRIFEPYFSMKGKGKGKGLGLSAAVGLMSRYQGAITVKSELGKGSVFTLLIPCVNSAQKKIEPHPLHIGSSIEKKCGDRVLIVEDEEDLAISLKENLEFYGYKVVAKTSSKDAIDLFYKEPDGFDVVMTDYNLPQISGDVLAVELMKIRPDIPVILCTGADTYINREKALSLGIKEFVMKPFIGLDFHELIQSVLPDKTDV